MTLKTGKAAALKPAVKIAILSIFITAVISCSSSRWSVRPPVLEKEYDIFDTSSVTGTGLKLESHSFQPRRCIKSSETSVTGGMLSFEFVDPASVMSGERGPFREFIRTAIRRASSYNITGMTPVSIACIVSVTGRMNYIIDNSIVFTGTAQGFLEKNDIDGFYSHCGTEFVDSTLFESGFAFVVTYYMPEDDASYFRKKISSERGPAASDINNFSVFREAGDRFPVFFSSSASTDSLFIPVEFPVAASCGCSSEEFLKKAIQSCLASASGRIISLHVKKWSELPGVSRYMLNSRGDRSPEMAHNSIESLSKGMIDFSLFRINPVKFRSAGGNEIFRSLTGGISWGNYYKCRWGIRLNDYIDPGQERDCADLVRGLTYFREIQGYNYTADEERGDKKFRGDSFSELRLIDPSVVDPGNQYAESDYRFRDKTVKNAMQEKVTPGETMDSSGKKYSSECINKDTMIYISNKNGGVSSIVNDCYPVDTRDQGIMSRIFMFWRKPTFRRPLYRGNVEVSTYSDELADTFTITEEAAELARNDLPGFYRKYGTHYVSQVKGRRGIVYYLSPGSSGDSDIKIEAYGVSISPLKQGGTVETPDTGSGCTSSVTGFFLKKSEDDPLLHPETVIGFFKSKEEFARIFAGDSDSIPAEIYLKPWSRYLVERGIIRTDQLVPAELFRDKVDYRPDGENEIAYKNGDRYVGMISNGLKNGYGEFKGADGSFYKGAWQGDLKHGRGTDADGKGNSYTGDFMYGYHHGTGEYTDRGGNRYRGTFYKGMMSGKGEMMYRDGRRYNGEFRNDEPDGTGLMEYPDGKRVEGMFKKGVYQKQ